MNETASKRTMNRTEQAIAAVFSVCIFLLLFTAGFAYAVPSGPTILFNSTENATPKPAAQITTAGGSFTTIILNASSQTPRWKAYVGNVTGRLVLADATNSSIFDWRLTSVTGEVYSTRNTTIDWSTMACGDMNAIVNEQTDLGMTGSTPDNINRTFNTTTHRPFYVGLQLIQNSTCPAISTYVNSTRQTVSESALFQEILLMDGSSRVVYTTLINQSSVGFNGQRYDFQMIVPENEFQSNPTTYYLYVELI